MVSIGTLLLIQFGFILILIIGWAIRNLWIKNKKLTKIVEEQDRYLKSVYDGIKYSQERVKEIDSKQIFQSDDEIGWFFTNLKKLQEVLTDYIQNIKV